MLKGTSIALRPIRESDLTELYDFHVDIDNRGDYFPRGIASQVTFNRQFQETGFWGATTEAVTLMTEYLFTTKPINRIRLVIHQDNAASRRIAEKCGFRHEGTARGAWYNTGRYQDVEIYAILHDDVIGSG